MTADGKVRSQNRSVIDVPEGMAAVGVPIGYETPGDEKQGYYLTIAKFEHFCYAPG